MKTYMKESLDLKVSKLRVSKYWGLGEIQFNSLFKSGFNTDNNT